MTTIRAVIICLSLVFIFSGCSWFSKAPVQQYAGEHGWDPTVACEYMSDKMTPGGYKNEGGTVYGCVSEEKNLGLGSPSNTVTYYARGEAERAREVGLRLKVNDPEKASDALQTLLEYSRQLSERSIGIPLSTSASRAILSGNGGRGKVGTTKIEILRQNFPDGKGYELSYIITPQL
jgi:hypothetical protein